MKNFLIGLFTFIGTTGISAQTQSITVHSQTTGKEEIIDVPESMQSEMDSLYWDWQSKNYITLGENCTMASTNPVVSDSIYMDRLSRIPSIIEMPYNEAVRKFIDMYAVRLRNKVSFMLAATNFYMPIFEEALDLYDLPQELKYLPIIESALNPVAVSRQGATGLWQFMLGTGKIYGLKNNSLIDERRDPVKSTWAAARYPERPVRHLSRLESGIGSLQLRARHYQSTKPYAVPEEPRIIGQSTTICPKKPVGTFLLS